MVTLGPSEDEKLSVAARRGATTEGFAGPEPPQSCVAFGSFADLRRHPLRQSGAAGGGPGASGSRARARPEAIAATGLNDLAVTVRDSKVSRAGLFAPFRPRRAATRSTQRPGRMSGHRTQPVPMARPRPGARGLVNSVMVKIRRDASSPSSVTERTHSLGRQKQAGPGLPIQPAMPLVHARSRASGSRPFMKRFGCWAAREADVPFGQPGDGLRG